MRRPLTFLEKKQRGRIEERAEKEAEWFFGVMGGRPPDEESTSPEVRSTAVHLRKLKSRAERYVAVAIRAVGKVRGDAPCSVEVRTWR
jgi:hypothetical protein